MSLYQKHQLTFLLGFELSILRWDAGKMHKSDNQDPMTSRHRTSLLPIRADPNMPLLVGDARPSTGSGQAGQP
jgi:hypothetical protein